MNKEILQKYAELKHQEKETKEKIIELAPVILSYMNGEQADKITSAFGTFSIEHRKDWRYTTAVDLAERKLKELQLNEQARGIAKFKERSVLKYFSPKENGKEI